MTTPIPPSDTIAPWGRQYFYWYHPAGPVEVKIGAGDWVTTTAGTDPNGVAGYRILIAGPDAAGNPVGTVVIALGQTWTESRYVGTEITFGKGRIDCA